MDLPEASLSKTNSSSSSDDGSYISLEDMAATFPRSRFFATYRRQQSFSFPPDSIIYYITKNPSSTKAYKKLIQSCKHFFIQNPIIVVSRLISDYFNFNEFRLCFDHLWIEHFNKISSKIWVTDFLRVENYFTFGGIQDHFSLNIVPKIYQCDVKQLILRQQNIRYNDFILLSSKCTYIAITVVTVTEEDDTVVPVEKLFASIPEILEFQYCLPENPINIITSKTAQELVKIPYLFNLQYFMLSELPEIFDIDTFYANIKKNTKTDIILEFNNQISENYESHLQAIVNEIIEAKNHDYFPPIISFSGNDQSSLLKLDKLFEQAKKRFK